MWWNSYIGTKFKDKGRGADGVDCWGLVCLIYRNELGIELPSYTECYENTDDKNTLTDLIANEQKSKWAEVVNMRSFDVLVLKIDGLPYHIGIYTHDNKFVHCERGFNTVVAKLDSFRWQRRLMGAFRWVK